MYYIVKSNKPFEQAASDLEAAVLRNGFGYCTSTIWARPCVAKA